MRWALTYAIVAAMGLSTSFGEGATALQAAKLLSKAQAKKLARIEGRDGNPHPDRWYLLVHDEADEKGLHEFVVAGSTIVASRPISQFAEVLTPADVVGRDAVRIDSDRLFKLAQKYAEANGVTLAKASFALQREGEAVVWKVTCVDENGGQLGTIVVAAAKGTVLSHEGFLFAPAAKTTRLRKLPVQTEPLIDASDAEDGSEPADDEKRGGMAGRKRGDESASGSERRVSVKGTLRNVGGRLRRLLPF